MKQRILTGLGLVAFLILIFFSKSVTTYIFDAFIILLAIYAGYEMSNILKKIGYYNNKWVIILYPVLAYGLYQICMLKKVPIYLMFVMQVALVILLVAVIAIWGVISRKTSENEIKTRKLKYSVEQFSIFKGIQTLFGLVYPGLILMLLIFVNNLQNLTYTFNKFLGYEYAISLFLLIFTFAMPIMVDTFAMLTGSLFKGKKLCPNLSPKKTISGAIGGFVWGMAGAVAIFFIFSAFDTYSVIFATLNITWWKVLIAGAVSAIVCQIGDLFESFLKRKANVKDSGDILPGHGGILDRIDSHIANVIVVFILMLVL